MNPTRVIAELAKMLTFFAVVSGLTFMVLGVAAPSPIILTRVQVEHDIAIDVKSIARTLLTPKAFKCWMGIVTAESHLDSNAKNPNSSATGLAQLLASTYTNIGMKPSSDPKAQFIAQLAYLSRHFGGPNGMCIAYQQELKFHNY